MQWEKVAWQHIRMRFFCSETLAAAFSTKAEQCSEDGAIEVSLSVIFEDKQNLC